MIPLEENITDEMMLVYYSELVARSRDDIKTAVMEQKSYEEIDVLLDRLEIFVQIEKELREKRFCLMSWCYYRICLK